MTTPQTTTTAAKNSDKKASDAKSPDAKAGTAAPPTKADASASTGATVPVVDKAEGVLPDTSETAEEEEKKERQKVYIIVGQVREFKNPAEAEKFLNKDPAAPKGDYVVIKGKQVVRKAKVSLR